MGNALPGASVYFPPAAGDWETIDPKVAGWDVAGLEAAFAYAGEQRSSGLLVLYGGRILAERNWEIEKDSARPERYSRMVAGRDNGGRAIEDVASAQKSVVSFLAGIARANGLLDFDAPVERYLGAGWSKAPSAAEAAITVRHLMSMSSGLTVKLELEQPAGKTWRYNTNAYSKLIPVLEKVSGLSIADITTAWLTSPIGMADSHWAPRQWVEADADANAIGFATTTRDLGRFGILVLAGGHWRQEDLLGDPGYFEQAWSPSQPHNRSYGLLWWLNSEPARPARAAEARRLAPAAPHDMVAAQGALGRKLYVVPSLGLVVVRLGDEPASDFNDQLWRRLVSAAPRAN